MEISEHVDDKSEGAPFNLLFLMICFGSIGILTNFYSTLYMRWNFIMSKMNYKLLICGCLVTFAECLIEVTVSIFLLKATNEFACMILQITYIAPKFITNALEVQMSLLR